MNIQTLIVLLIIIALLILAVRSVRKKDRLAGDVPLQETVLIVRRKRKIYKQT